MAQIGEGSAVSDVVTCRCRDDWDECQKKQACAKIKALDNAAKNKQARKRPLTPRLKKAKKSWQAKYWRDNPPPGGDWAHECAKTNGRPVQADHCVDVQYGGKVKGPFSYLDASVNMSIGSQLASSEVQTPSGFASENCGCS